MTYRINVSLDANGDRRAELECEPASLDEQVLAHSAFSQTMRQLHHPTFDSPQEPDQP